MLKHITYTFPNGTPNSLGFIEQLIELLTELPNAHMQENGGITITASKPSDAPR